MAIYHVSITGRDRRHLTELGQKQRIVVVGYRELAKGVVVDAYVRPAQIPWLEKHGYGVERLEDVARGDRRRQAEERKATARRTRSGHYGDVMWAGGYLTVDEVERALVLGAERHPGVCQRIALPNRTWEQRRCHALSIVKGRRRPAICLIGGMHAREWGSPDILVYFAWRLLRAYRDRRGIRLGENTFSPAQIRTIVEQKGVVVFPQVNPDGRRFSMEGHPMWRKNRRPAPAGRGPTCVGVDLNRNFPWMWRIERYFAPGTADSSSHPGHYETYCGPRAASEPETRNVMWLLERQAQVRYFVDVHSYGETILYSWGSDDNQSHDPAMSFMNPAYDGKRGRIHDRDYREYIPARDLKTAVGLGRRMAGAIRRVRGRQYSVRQSVGLYPRAGSSDDYAYARHRLDPRKSKVLAFTVEWGRSRAATPFHPPYPEMRKVMREITAGLLEFCLRAK